MLYKRRASHEALCILRVSADVLHLPGVVVADMNAASDYVRFGPAPAALANIDRDLVFAEYWRHPDDHIRELRHRSIKCAEVLVPERVETRHVLGACVSCAESHAATSAVAPRLAVHIDTHLFFR